MSKVKVVLNKAGVRELLKDPGVGSFCLQKAREVQMRAGENFEAEARNYPERTGAAVHPANAEGYYDNLNNNTLLRSLK